jgi:hypothetical protein
MFLYVLITAPIYVWHRISPHVHCRGFGFTIILAEEIQHSTMALQTAGEEGLPGGR